MREKILFNDGWRFHKGDSIAKTPLDKGPVYTAAKTERCKWGLGAKAYNGMPDSFDDNAELREEKWERVTLPHDYIIEQTPSPENNNALGFFKYENAWYRKNFTLTEDDLKKRLYLLFDGVATHCTVYLNGCLIKRNFCGYTPFEADITEIAAAGDNVIAVFVDAQPVEGWWYAGAGIYRDVYLVKTERISVDLWGDYIHTERIDSKKWRIYFETTVRNDTDSPEKIHIASALCDTDVAGECDITVPARDAVTASYSAEIEDPRLWNIDAPNMYRAKTVLTVEGKAVDEIYTNFGIREFRADPDKGLFINGKHVKIKGVCAHGDFSLTGKAVPENVQRYRISLLKEMGANGYRCSHYPHSEYVMDELDREGFIVMAETRWFDTCDESMQQLETLIKRDRNHPSVFFWSLGNEEAYHVKPQGVGIYKKMAALVRRLDNTRLITSAVSVSPEMAPICECMDAIGINYNLQAFDTLKKKFPDKPIFSSECCATGSSRSWYWPDSEKYLSSYDKDTNNWFLGREKTWKFMNERNYIMGMYQWNAFEYRGESSWPRLCSQSGAIDFYLQKKDAFYQNMSHWVTFDEKPMIHVMPHWNFEGYEGEILRVVVYTNCPSVELFLNGRSLGKRISEAYTHLEWNVGYERGEIAAVGYDEQGREILRDVRKTSGRPAALRLAPMNDARANGRDMLLAECWCEDENGDPVPDADVFVNFHSNALGRIAGTGADITDHIPPKSPDRKMFRGKITIAVKVGVESGELKLYADCPGIRSAVMSYKLKK